MGALPRIALKVNIPSAALKKQCSLLIKKAGATPIKKLEKMNNEFPFNHFLNLSSSSKKEQPPIAPISEEQMPLFQSMNNKNQQDATPPAHKEMKGASEGQSELIAHQHKILNTLKDFINPQKYNAFFAETFFLKNWSPEKVVFRTTTLFIKKMIENYYYSQLCDIVYSLSGARPLVVIEVSAHAEEFTTPLSQPTAHIVPEVSASMPAPKTVKDARFTIDLIPTREDLQNQVDSKVISHLSEVNFGFTIDPKKTFDNFIIGPSNNMVVASAKAASKAPGKVYPTLYLHSNSGLGKTHILHAVANYIKDNFPSLRICLISTTDFLNDMIDSMTKNKMPDFRRKYTDLVDLLMIDDVHELKGKTQTQNEFFYVFNELHNKHKQLIFTSDRPPNEIDGLEERIRTRLSWGLVLDIQPPDLETRIAILKKKALAEDIYLPEDVIHVIADSIRTNIRELEGSLIRLAAYSSIFKVDIDVEIAKEQLKLKNTAHREIKTLETVAKVTSTFFKIPIPDLRSKVRTKDVTLGRHVAMYLSYNLLGATLTDIGQYYGNRDHTSVLHAIEKIKLQIKNDLDLAKMIQDLERSYSLS